MTYHGDDIHTESTPSNPYGSRSNSPISAATDIFAQFDPFAGRGGKAGKVNAGGPAAVSSSARSDSVADSPPGDMRTMPAQKTPTKKIPTGNDVPVPSTTLSPLNEDCWMAVPTKNNKKAGTPFTGYDNTGTAHLQTAVAPSTASSTWATPAASVTALEQNVASGTYGRPGLTTPQRDSGSPWFKPVSTYPFTVTLPCSFFLVTEPHTPLPISAIHNTQLFYKKLTSDTRGPRRRIRRTTSLKHTAQQILRLTLLRQRDPSITHWIATMKCRHFGAAALCGLYHVPNFLRASCLYYCCYQLQAGGLKWRELDRNTP